MIKLMHCDADRLFLEELPILLAATSLIPFFGLSVLTPVDAPAACVNAGVDRWLGG
jgi:hypothetical protein